MKKVLPIVLFLAITTMPFAQAAEPAPSSPPAPTTQKEESHKLSDNSKLWLGLGMGTFIGFGSGHALQDRWQKTGWIFTVGDGLGLGLLVAGMGSGPDGRSKTQKSLTEIGAVLYLSSRVAEFVELIVYGVNHDMFSSQEKAKEKTNAVIFTPEIKPDSIAINASVWRF